MTSNFILLLIFQVVTHVLLAGWLIVRLRWLRRDGCATVLRPVAFTYLGLWVFQVIAVALLPFVRLF